MQAFTHGLGGKNQNSYGEACFKTPTSPKSFSHAFIGRAGLL
jgi:hypothetical protein